MSVPEGLPLGRGDERRLHQVLLNLAGNAVKFTETGSIEIAAGVRDGDFEVMVRDTGPGIALEHQARIFEEFQQVDDSNTRQKGRLGTRARDLQADRRNARRIDRNRVHSRRRLYVPR